MTYVNFNGQCLPAHPVYPSSTQIAARIRQIILNVMNPHRQEIRSGQQQSLRIQTAFRGVAGGTGWNRGKIPVAGIV